MKELAYLLQDIQDEDKDDAVQYYTDYFEEAGPDKEAEVIQELGSPERIAAIIRADIAGHLESGGEFTEQGYQDERFRDPGYAMAKRLDLPEEQESGGQGSDSRGQGYNREQNFDREQSFDQKRGFNHGPEQTYTEENNGTSNPPPPRTSKVIKLIWGHHLCSAPGRYRYASLRCVPHVFPSTGWTHGLRHRIDTAGRRCPVPGSIRTVLREVHPFHYTKYRKWA